MNVCSAKCKKCKKKKDKDVGYFMMPKDKTHSGKMDTQMYPECEGTRFDRDIQHKKKAGATGLYNIKSESINAPVPPMQVSDNLPLDAHLDSLNKAKEEGKQILSSGNINAFYDWADAKDINLEAATAIAKDYYAELKKQFETLKPFREDDDYMSDPEGADMYAYDRLPNVLKAYMTASNIRLNKFSQDLQKSVTFYQRDYPNKIFAIIRDGATALDMWSKNMWEFEVNGTRYKAGDWKGREAIENLFGESVHIISKKKFNLMKHMAALSNTSEEGNTSKVNDSFDTKEYHDGDRTLRIIGHGKFDPNLKYNAMLIGYKGMVESVLSSATLQEIYAWAKEHAFQIKE